MIPSPLRRPLRWATVTSAAAIAVVLGVSGTANAASGTVNTSGANLTVRAAPGSQYNSYGSRSDGATVTITCQTSGSSVTGTYGTSSIWDMISSGGFIADAYVHTGSDGYVAPKCVYSPAPARANPRGRNAAINWEFGHLGSTAYEGWCMKFQGLAYGWSYSGFSTAEVGGDWMVNHGYMHTSGIPPRGALVWYHNSSGTGHVVISLGEGKIIGTSVGGKVGVAGYKYRTGYRGWSPADFPNAG